MLSHVYQNDVTQQKISKNKGSVLSTPLQEDNTFTKKIYTVTIFLRNLLLIQCRKKTKNGKVEKGMNRGSRDLFFQSEEQTKPT